MHVTASPPFQTIGNLKVDVAAGPIARMFAAEAWLEPANAGGGAVFSGRAGEVIENIVREAGQDASPEGLFNLDAHIYDTASGHPVPYLDVRADLQRGDHRVFTGIPLVPVARPWKRVAGLHYGNNVAIEPTGTYRVVVHISAGALTGTVSVSDLAFTLDFDHPDR